MLYRIDDKLHVKVADFGFSRDVYATQYYRLGHKTRLPVKWMPPESLLDNIYNERSDVVSVLCSCAHDPCLCLWYSRKISFRISIIYIPMCILLKMYFVACVYNVWHWNEVYCQKIQNASVWVICSACPTDLLNTWCGMCPCCKTNIQIPLIHAHRKAYSIGINLDWYKLVQCGHTFEIISIMANGKYTKLTMLMN